MDTAIFWTLRKKEKEGGIYWTLLADSVEMV